MGTETFLSMQKFIEQAKSTRPELEAKQREEKSIRP